MGGLADAAANGGYAADRGGQGGAARRAQDAGRLLDGALRDGAGWAQGAGGLTPSLAEALGPTLQASADAVLASAPPGPSVIGADALAALDRAWGPPARAPGTAEVPDLRLGPLARLGAGVGAALLVLTPSATAREVVVGLGPDLRARRMDSEALGQVERRVDGRWEPTGVTAALGPDGGLRIHRAALERAVGPLPPGLDGVLGAALGAGPGAAAWQAQPDNGGWVEGYPALTDEERRLGELPGFAPEPLPPHHEEFPALEPERPQRTGHGSSLDGLGLNEPLITVPAPEELRGATIHEMPRPGEPTPIRPQDDAETQRAHRRENEVPDILRGEGNVVVPNPVVPGPRKPDFLVNGEVFDNYAPSTGNVRNIWFNVRDKVEGGQAPNIVLDLRDSAVDEAALRQQFTNWPIEGLGEVILIRPDNSVGRL